MKKIIIFGNSGSGKSTLAKSLVKDHQLAHLDLDILAWQATDPPTRKPVFESKKAIDQFCVENESWVIEGCYADLLQLVFDQAEEAIFMNLPVSMCQENAMKRPWEKHKYNSKDEQDAHLPMLLEWMAEYTERTNEFSYQAHLSLYKNFNGSKRQITQNQRIKPNENTRRI